MMSSMMSEEEMAQMEQGTTRKPDQIRLSFIVIRLDH